jgi:hypothetical protein
MWAPVWVGLPAIRLVSICPLVLVCRCPDSHSAAPEVGYLNLRRFLGLGRDGRGGGVAIVFPVVWVGGLALVFWALNACMDELRKLKTK